MTLYTPVLWFYEVMASLVFGATVYETLVVHPAWSRKPPETFRGFRWNTDQSNGSPDVLEPVAALYALSGLGALGLALRTGSQGVAIIASAVCAIAVVAWTLIYFPPHDRAVSWRRRREHSSRSAPRPKRAVGFGSTGSALAWSRCPGGGALGALARHG
jgi:hypothetical protein